MLPKDKKNKKRRNFGEEVLFPIFLVFFLVFIGIFLIITNWNIGKKRADLTAQIDSLQKEVADLEKKNTDLKDQVSQAGSKDYIESVAREKLGMKAPGEEVLALPNDSSVQGTPTPTPVPVSQKQNWWQWIASKF